MPRAAMTGREVLAFDLYGTLVNPIAIAGELGQILGDSDGREVAGLWRLKQLEYSFRLTAMGQYEDFAWVTSRALDFALASIGTRLPEGQVRRLAELYDHLEPFPDAVPALQALAGLGYECAVLSNGTPAMIANCLGNSGLGGFFGQRISVDEVRLFKPSPVVYRHAAGRLSVPVGQVRLVTSNAFDCVGAGAAGRRTAWVYRSAAPFDTIGQPPDLTVPALDRLPVVLAG
jgi:2-haloacid dehalogenase